MLVGGPLPMFRGRMKGAMVGFTTCLAEDVKGNGMTVA